MLAQAAMLVVFVLDEKINQGNNPRLTAMKVPKVLFGLWDE